MHRLDGLADERLQHVALDRQLQSRHRREARGISRHRQAHRVRRDEAREVSTPLTRSAVSADAGHFAVLDDVNAVRAGAAGVTPGDRIMAHGAAAPLQEAAENRVAAVVQVHQRHQRLHLRAADGLRVHTEQAHLVGAAREQIPLRLGVEQVEGAALAHHRVEVELLLQALPEFQRELIEADVGRVEVVGAHDGRVAPDVAQSDRSLLQHRDVGDAVFARKVDRRSPDRGRRRPRSRRDRRAADSPWPTRATSPAGRAGPRAAAAGPNSGRRRGGEMRVLG